MLAGSLKEPYYSSILVLNNFKVWIFSMHIINPLFTTNLHRKMVYISKQNCGCVYSFKSSSFQMPSSPRNVILKTTILLLLQVWLEGLRPYRENFNDTEITGKLIISDLEKIGYNFPTRLASSITRLFW